MNEEYLWSRKGEDAEIQRLEELLSEFRFNVNPTPEFPALPAVEYVPKRRRFVWAFGFATAAMATILLAVVMFSFKSAETAERVIPSIMSTPEKNRPVYESPSPFHSVGSAQLVVANENRRVDLKRRTVYRRPAVDKIKFRPAAAVQTLTREERFAYERLKLALAIAGSKLKVVQDTIDRTADSNFRNTRNEK